MGRVLSELARARPSNFISCVNFPLGFKIKMKICESNNQKSTPKIKNQIQNQKSRADRFFGRSEIPLGEGPARSRSLALED